MLVKWFIGLFKSKRSVVKLSVWDKYDVLPTRVKTLRRSSPESEQDEH